MNEAKATVMRRRWPALLAIALIFCAAVVVIISAIAGLSLASMSFGCVAAVLRRYGRNGPVGQRWWRQSAVSLWSRTLLSHLSCPRWPRP